MITWTNPSGFSANVDILLSTDGGATYATTIASNVANTGSFVWTVPNSLTTTARIEVRAHVGGVPAGTSSANFAIVALTITTNPSDQTINSGGTATFTAAASGNSGVQWQISSDGGGTWSNLSGGGDYSGVTTTTLTVTGASPAINGSLYRAVFLNSANVAATSASAQLIVLSPYAYSAYYYAYYEYVYASCAYTTDPSYYTYLAMTSAYSSFYYAYEAYYYNSTGNQALSQYFAYYAYYEGYVSAYYSSYVYTGA